jgi:hypothetical protein
LSSPPSLEEVKRGFESAVAGASVKLTALTHQLERLSEDEVVFDSKIAIRRREFEHQAEQLEAANLVRRADMDEYEALEEISRICSSGTSNIPEPSISPNTRSKVKLKGGGVQRSAAMTLENVRKEYG